MGKSKKVYVEGFWFTPPPCFCSWPSIQLKKLTGENPDARKPCFCLCRFFGGSLISFEVHSCTWTHFEVRIETSDNKLKSMVETESSRPTKFPSVHSGGVSTVRCTVQSIHETAMHGTRMSLSVATSLLPTYGVQDHNNSKIASSKGVL